MKLWLLVAALLLGCDDGTTAAEPADGGAGGDLGRDAAPVDAGAGDDGGVAPDLGGALDATPTPDAGPDGPLPDMGPGGCGRDDDCHSDMRCVDGACVPWGMPPDEVANGACGLPPEIAEFQPEVQCHWNGGQVSGQAIAIDLDGDEVPSIVFVSGGSLVALRGDDCTEEMRSNVGLLSNESSPAAGDIDADGLPEVVAVGGLGLVAVDHEFNLEWTAGTNALGLASAPAIADLDGDGMPEVISGGTALNGEDGSVHGQGPAAPSHSFGPIPAVADVDGDGRQEVLYGNRIYDADMTDVTPEAMAALPAGTVAVADFDPETPEPELAVVFGATGVRVQRLDGEVIFGPYTVPGSMWSGGAPNVGDFDGDGQPEIGTAGSTNYAVLDLECSAEPLPGFCERPGIRWLSASRDTSSGSTGSTTFDFEGDGRLEVVYNDECFLRVYDGSTGEVRLALANTTGTLIEAPIVLDVDGDYNSEIVVGSDQGFPCNEADPHTGTPARQTQGITVLRDVGDRWVHSRPIWNQNAYSITNVENDGTIPREPEPSWARYNSFRENAAPDDKALEAPDLTARQDTPVARDGCGPATLAVTIHNRGAQPISRGVPVTFYDRRSEDGGQPVCATATTTRLAPGEGEEVSCVWQAPPNEGATAWAYADREVVGGIPLSRNAECAERNNFTTLEVPACE